MIHMLLFLLGFLLITASLTIMCHAVGDGIWLHSLLYVLSVYGVIFLFVAGIFFIVQGTS